MEKFQYKYLIIVLVIVVGLVAYTQTGSSNKPSETKSDVTIQENEMDKNIKNKTATSFENDAKVYRVGQYTKPTKEELKARLSELQYKVTQEEGTERAFDNEYWDNKEEGVYVDVVSGEPLFSSKDKYKSGTGWPSFSKPIGAGVVVEKKDQALFMTRTEIRSHHADSHLGHVFEDGPASTGLRYCMNSASLEFIPVKDLAKRGLGEYQNLFE